MASSDIDLTSYGTDDPIPILFDDTAVTTSSRRQKREKNPSITESPNNNAISSYGESSALALPFVFLFHFMVMMKILFYSVLREPFRVYEQVTESNRAVNEVLETMPKKTKILKRDLKKVGLEQEILNDRMDDLRRRIQKIESRRKKWAEEAERIQKVKAEADKVSDDAKIVGEEAEQVLKMKAEAKKESNDTNEVIAKKD
uniref:Uncharacterized protein n=1 Tax=Helicotheca tamesis TaxID=374047 RepID=A0A6U0G6S4_9STRA